MKKNGLTALNLFVKFTRNIGMTQPELAAAYLEDDEEEAYKDFPELLKVWVHRGEIPPKERLGMTEKLSKLFTSPNEKLLRAFGSSEGLIEYFLNYLEDNGYVVKDRRKAMDNIRLFLLEFFSDERIYPPLQILPSALHSHPAQCSECFYGREKLIWEIHRAFGESSVVFLVGMGGIGKSELAKQYAKAFKQAYDTVVFARYEQEKGLAALLSNDAVFRVDGICRFEDPKETDFDYACRKIEKIKKTSDGRTLVILDNYDTDRIDDLLPVLFSGDYRVLITSRYDREKKYKQIQVNEICEDEQLKDLVIGYSRPYVAIKRSDPNFEELFRITCRHTLTLELVSLYMAENSYTLKQTIEILKSAGVGSLSDCVVTHDDKSKTVRDFIRELFLLEYLSADEKQFLRLLTFTPDAGIEEDIFKEWVGDLFFTARTKLIKKRLLKYDSENGLLILHPIIREVVLSELKPTYTGCKEFFDGFAESMDDLAFFNYPIEKRRIYAECGMKIRNVLPLSRETFSLFYEIEKTTLSTSDIRYALAQRQTLYDFASKEYGETSTEACMIAIQLGQVYRAMNEYDKAFFYLKDIALRILLSDDSLSALHLDLLERCYDQLGYLYLEHNKNNRSENDFIQAEECFRKGYDAVHEMHESPALSKAELLYKRVTPILGLCKLYFECENSQKLSENIQILSETFDSIKGLGGSVDIDTFYVYMYRCKYYYLQKSYKKALEQFEKAVKQRNNNYSRMSTSMIELYIYAADCCSKVENIEKEKMILNDASKIAKQLCIPNSYILKKIQTMQKTIQE